MRGSVHCGPRSKCGVAIASNGHANRRRPRRSGRAPAASTLRWSSLQWIQRLQRRTAARRYPGSPTPAARRPAAARARIRRRSAARSNQCSACATHTASTLASARLQRSPGSTENVTFAGPARLRTCAGARIGGVHAIEHARQVATGLATAAARLPRASRAARRWRRSSRTGRADIPVARWRIAAATAEK